MGRYQLVVLSQPSSDDVSELERAVVRSLELAPIRFVDALMLTKNENDEICFAAVCDIDAPDRAWRGLIAQALFGREAAASEPWHVSRPPDRADAAFELSEVQLLEIGDRIPRQSSALIVLVEHQWMDELTDALISPGLLVANGWISIHKLMEMRNATPHLPDF